nr:hypothetical protein [Tanacetum cinerariifolium]
DYGVVVDAFIPYKKSKAGKLFAFIRFIKVDKIDRLVMNLCAVSIGRFHLYENVARFHREHKTYAPSHLSNANVKNSQGSFVSILKLDKTNNIMSRQETKACDPFNFNDTYESGSSDDDEDVNDEGSQSRYKVTLNNDVKRVSKSSYSGDDLKYPSGFKPSMMKVEEVNEKEKWATSNEVNDHVNSTSNKLEEPVPKGKLTSNDSVCSKRVHMGGSIFQFMDELVKIVQTIGYNMEGYMKKGILCVWEPTLFVKDNIISSDSLLAIMGTWVPSSSKLLIISVYAPQELTEKRVLWDYILRLIDRWDGDCVIMRDSNKVRTEQKIYGSAFNVQGANAFNSFISFASLIHLAVDCYTYTWAHKTAIKMKDTSMSLATADSNGGSNKEILSNRSLLLKELNDVNSIDSLEAAQKSSLGYRRLSLEQQVDIKRNISNDEIKGVFWIVKLINPLVLMASLLSSFVDIGTFWNTILWPP